MLTLPEASYLYLGLAIQALVRSSALRYLPGPLVAIWVTVLLLRQEGTAYAWRTLGYGVAALGLVICFWPEATIFFERTLQQTTGPAQVASYAAQQDGEATVITAEDTGQVPEPLRQPVLVPAMFRLLLRGVTGFPLALARVINSDAHRAFASLMPMQWLLGVQLTAPVTAAVQDWVHNCYIVVFKGTWEAGQAVTAQDLLPWGDTPLRQALTTREVIPGAQTGVPFLQGPNPSNLTRCDIYLDNLEFATQSWLYDLKSPRGTPLLQVFQEDLGMDSVMQARFVIYREILRAAGPAVPAPSLLGAYASLRGLAMGGSVIGGAAAGAATAGGWAGALFGALTGGIRGIGNEFQNAVSGLSRIVAWALLATWYAPYILGAVNLVLVGLFPILLLWALMTRHIASMMQYYVMTLLFTCSSSLWWALVDQCAKLAASQPPQIGTGWDAAVAGFLVNGLWVASITALGLIVIPAIVAGIFLYQFSRSAVAAWRGGVG